MNRKIYIANYCHILNGQVYINGKLLFEKESDDLKSFLTWVYREKGIQYAKFFKMDNLCKLAFLSVELMLMENKDSKKSNTALVFSNRASSLDTDRKFQSSLNKRENSFPSPAVFVYTLPNISLGEISIRHEFRGENGFFVFDDYQAQFHHLYEKDLMGSGNADELLGGWVDVDGDQYLAFVYQIAYKGKIEHTEKNLIKLYNEYGKFKKRIKRENN